MHRCERSILHTQIITTAGGAGRFLRPAGGPQGWRRFLAAPPCQKYARPSPGSGQALRLADFGGLPSRQNQCLCPIQAHNEIPTSERAPFLKYEDTPADKAGVGLRGVLPYRSNTIFPRSGIRVFKVYAFS